MIGGHFPVSYKDYRHITKTYRKEDRRVFMNTRDWRISNFLDDMEAMLEADPTTPIGAIIRLAKLEGLRDDEMWKVEHLYQDLTRDE